jgi:hypothetical protein
MFRQFSARSNLTQFASFLIYPDCIRSLKLYVPSAKRIDKEPPEFRRVQPTWIPRNLPRGARRGGKHACRVLAQSADATNVFQLANDVWKRACLAITLQVARMPAEPSDRQELPRAPSQAR